MILVKAYYPQSPAWESYQADTEDEIVAAIESELSDIDNFKFSIDWDFDEGTGADENPIEWEMLKRMAALEKKTKINTYTLGELA